MYKLSAQRLHAKHRAEERYNLTFNKETLKRLSIQARQSKPIKRISRSLVIHQLNYCNNILNVVYDSRRQQIISFLPKHIRENRHGL